MAVAKIKIIEYSPKFKRFGDLASGELFYACGDVTIKVDAGVGVVLKDGNYVLRNENDFVEVIDYAELHIGKAAPEVKEEQKPIRRSPVPSDSCKYYTHEPLSSVGTCNAESGIVSSMRYVRCGGRCDKCENDRFDCE